MAESCIECIKQAADELEPKRLHVDSFWDLFHEILIRAAEIDEEQKSHVLIPKS